MRCRLSFGECLLAVLTAASFIILVCFTWEARQSAMPPPPVEYSYHRPPMRGYPALYPPPWPLMDIKATSLIANSATCDNTDKPILLLYLVFSHPSHIKLRNAHRAHTSQEVLQSLGARRVFLLADGSRTSQKGYPVVPMSTVLKESANHRDIVLANFTDHYHNLTYKHALGLTWANRFCPKALYIFKMDDDIMVDVWGMANLLRSGLVTDNVGVVHSAEGEKVDLDHRGTWAAGLVQRGLRPQRKKGKWKVTVAEFPFQMYPNYLSGWAYLITQPGASAIMKAASNDTPFWIDDVYMTGILASKAGVPRYALNHHYSLVTRAATCCLSVVGNDTKSSISFSNTAPLCNLLVAPSEKNVTLLSLWLSAAKKCHEGFECPQLKTGMCPPTRPHYGVGTVIPLS